MGLAQKLGHRVIPLVARVSASVGPCDRRLNRFRRATLPGLTRWSERRYDRTLVRPKSESHTERVAKTTAPICEIEEMLYEGGYRRSALATLKYLGSGEDRIWESASWAKHDGQWQHHCYLFESGDWVYIYHHKEWSYLDDPIKHENAEEYQTDGDPDGVLRDALGNEVNWV
jgi:hypothetical protein